MECIKEVMSFHQIHNFNKFSQFDLIKFLENFSEKINIRSFIFSLTSYEILTVNSDEQFSFSTEIMILKSGQKSIYVKNFTDKICTFISMSENFTPKYLKKARVFKYANFLFCEDFEQDALNATEVYMKNSLDFRMEPNLKIISKKESKLKIDLSTSHLNLNHEIDRCVSELDEINNRLISLKTIS